MEKVWYEAINMRRSMRPLDTQPDSEPVEKCGGGWIGALEAWSKHCGCMIFSSTGAHKKFHGSRRKHLISLHKPKLAQRSLPQIDTKFIVIPA
jgi:hypothetical protein